MFTIVRGALCVLLAPIGVLNFINSMVTSVLTRWSEIAMLTGKQVKKMLVFEDLGYAVLDITLSLVLATLVNVTVLQSLTSDMSYFTYRFILAPALLCTIPILTVTAVVPWPI